MPACANPPDSRLTLSESTYHRVNERFETDPGGSVEAKHKGRLETYILGRLKPEFAQNKAGRVPQGDRFSATE